jgi:hypothetical protein
MNQQTKDKLIKDINTLISRYLDFETNPVKGLNQRKKGELFKIKNNLVRAVSLQNQARCIEQGYEKFDWLLAATNSPDVREDVLSAYNRSQHLLKEASQLWLIFKRGN